MFFVDTSNRYFFLSSSELSLSPSWSTSLNTTLRREGIRTVFHGDDVRSSQLNVVFNKELVDVPGESFLLVIVDKLVVGPIGADGDDRKVSCFVP